MSKLSAVVFATFVVALILCVTPCAPTGAELTGEPPSLLPYPAGAKIYFRDTFQREKPEEGEWTRVCGQWDFDKKAKPGVSANPFSVVGSSPDRAILVTGYDWWQNYYFNGALRTPPIFNTFGAVHSFRGNGNYIFFGFSSADGLVLRLYQNGSFVTLASKDSFPVPYQWYDIGIAVHGKTVFAMMDRRLVFTSELPYKTCGRAGVIVTGAPDYGMTVDDCGATSLQRELESVKADSENGFTGLFAQDILGKKKFPAFFEYDHLMRKWASNEADWHPYMQPEPKEGEQPAEPERYTYPMPLFNDVSMQLKFPDVAREPSIALYTYEQEKEGELLCRFSFTVENNAYTAVLTDRSNRERFRKADYLKLEDKLQLFFDDKGVTFGKPNGEKTFVELPGLRKPFEDGVRVVINRWTYEISKFGFYNVVSSGLFEDTFYQSPSNWLTPYGNWQIAWRWACNPRYTYLSSWDRMSSQLYSKHRFGGNMHVELWFSPKMASLARPSYYPVRWFSISMPQEAGDFSRGYTCAIGSPGSKDFSLYRDGRSVASKKLKGGMTGSALHHTWFHVLMHRTANRLTCDMNFINEAKKNPTYRLEHKARQDLKPLPFAIWNSLTGLTVTRVRISAQKIEWGAMEKAVRKSSPSPCGVETSVVQNRPPGEYAAPSFDFSKGSAGWYVPSTQPALQAVPYPSAQNRSALAITAPFCGSRMEFVSPDMNVDARVWQTLTVRYRTDVALDLYIHSGSRKFRVLLDDRNKENTPDWAIPVGRSYYKKGIKDGYKALTVNLREMFEEYQTLNIPPIVDKISFERIDYSSASSLGVEEKDQMNFAVASVEFSSSFPYETLEDIEAKLPPDVKNNPLIPDFNAGLSAKLVKMDPASLAAKMPEQDERGTIRRNGALVIQFNDGLQGLSPIGSVEETLLWRKREDRRDYLVAHKSGRFGFLGVKLAPEPISLAEYPSLSLRLKGDLGKVFIGVKAGTWKWIPLKVKATSASAAKLSSVAPAVLTKGDVKFVVIHFPDHPALKGINLLEEVILCSQTNRPPALGAKLEISDIAFYNPTKLKSFAIPAGGAIPVMVGKGEQAQHTRNVQKARIRRSELYLVTLVDRERLYEPDTITVELEGSRIAFTLDEAPALTEFTITVGKQTFDMSDLYCLPSLKKIYLDRADVFNAEAGEVEWTAQVSTRKVGSGKLTFPGANAPKIRRAMVVPEDSLVFEDYEYGMGAAASRGTPIFLAGTFPYMGSSYLENLDPGIGKVAGFLVKKKFDAMRYPYMRFACRLNNAMVNLHFKCEGHYKDVQVSPYDGKQGSSYWTQGVFGSLSGIKDDNRWHEVKFRLTDKLDAQPFNDTYFIEQVCIRSFSDKKKGGSLGIDNLCIYGERSNFYTVTVEPPLGMPKANFEFEWHFTDYSGAKQLSDPVRVSETRFIARKSQGINPSKLAVRLIVNGKPSPEVALVELE
ncbi:MAG: hypothetical protein U5N86_10880 [Planctomycetota bacterium]|nr:hypothetical protein [Planctomycetota bacterium]